MKIIVRLKGLAFVAILRDRRTNVKQFAEKIGTAPSYLYRLGKGKGSLGVNMQRRIHKQLGYNRVKFDDIFKIEELSDTAWV